MSNKVQVKDLSVIYTFGKSSFKAVKNVDFDIQAGEIVGLIGESGSGKTSTAKAILGQIPFFADSVNINGIDIPHTPELKNKKLKNRIANNVQMIYQSPSASLNPYKRVWKAVAEGMYNIKLSKQEAEARLDNAQKKYIGQIFAFNNVLQSEDIKKDIEKMNQIEKDIAVANKKLLSINPDNKSTLRNEELVALDKDYNDRIDYINNRSSSTSSNLELRVNSAIRNTKKRFKAHFENIDIQTDLEIKELRLKIRQAKKQKTDTDKLATKLKTAQESKKEQLDKINANLKVELDKIKEAKVQLVAETKEKKSNLDEDYKKLLAEYQEARTNKIRKISHSGVALKTKQDIRDIKWIIKDLYDRANKLEDKLRAELSFEAKEQGKLEEFKTLEADRDAKVAKVKKYKKRPYGSKKDIKERAMKLIEEVGLNRKIAYSHIPQLSGGQQQRVAIARAFAMNPKFIIADEPIASLDVSLQGSVVNLIKDFAEKRGTAVLFITHDLDMVRRIASRMLVMYRGNVVERGGTKNIFEKPVHPYTKMLMSSSLTIDEALEGKPNYIYTGKEHIESKDAPAYHKVGAGHEILANTKEVKAWGGK